MNLSPVLSLKRYYKNNSQFLKREIKLKQEPIVEDLVGGTEVNSVDRSFRKE